MIIEEIFLVKERTKASRALGFVGLAWDFFALSALVNQLRDSAGDET